MTETASTSVYVQIEDLEAARNELTAKLGMIDSALTRAYAAKNVYENMSQDKSTQAIITELVVNRLGVDREQVEKLWTQMETESTEVPVRDRKSVV